MEEMSVIGITRAEAEAIIENMRAGPPGRFGWKCCGGPHTCFPGGNPHGHAASCPIKPLHNLLDPEGSLPVKL